MHPLAFAEVPAPTAIPNTSNATTTFIMKSPLSLLMSQETHAGLVPWPAPTLFALGALFALSTCTEQQGRGENNKSKDFSLLV
jgi:hypothetical protein